MRPVYDPMYHGECNRSEIKCQEHASQSENPLLEHTLQGDIKDSTGSLERPIDPPFTQKTYKNNSKRNRKIFKKTREILHYAYKMHKSRRYATFLDALLDAWFELYHEDFFYDKFLSLWEFYIDPCCDYSQELARRKLQEKVFTIKKGYKFEKKWSVFLKIWKEYDWEFPWIWTDQDIAADIWCDTYFDSWYYQKFLSYAEDDAYVFPLDY